MAPNDSSSSHQKSTGKKVLTVRTNKDGVKQVCFAKRSRTGEERATRETSRVQASSSSMHSTSSSTTMNTAPENPLGIPSSGSQSANTGPSQNSFAKRSRTGEERATRETSRVQASSSSMHSNSSSATMNTAPENPLGIPSSGSQSANTGARPVLGHDDIPPSSQQMNVDAVHRPRPSSPEGAVHRPRPSSSEGVVHRPRPSSSKGERMRRLQANGLPFFPNSFLRYHQAQKNYEKMKTNKAESGKDK
ncbi:hypothetical protein MMC29_004445 [Sticta canariensis]|nr:hypothetical protein [Sticta canariensis]